MQLPVWLSERRDARRQRYADSPAPSLKYGLTIRLDTRGLRLDGREEHDSEQILTLEHEGCEVRNLFEVLDDERVREHLLSTVPAERTRLDDFAEAFFDIGLYVHVPKGADAHVDLTRTLRSETFTEHVLIVCEENARLTVIDRYTDDGCSLRAGTVEVIALAGAHVRFASVQALGEGCVDLSAYRARLSDGARIDWFVSSFGGSLTHANVDTRLAGAHAHARSYGVFHGTGAQQFDLSASSFHEGNATVSDMYTRGVLDGTSKAVYRGNIDIAAKAFGCNGYQKEEVILLSPGAVADAIPNLEIRNNDVKCSHGATIGRVDAEQLFYLTSRGIPEAEAVRMVVEGFFEPLTARIEWPELFDVLRPLVEGKVRP